MDRDAHAVELDHCQFTALIPEVGSHQAMFALPGQSARQHKQRM
ncbi:hypothetical protein [Streptomyces bacillaris]